MIVIDGDRGRFAIISIGLLRSYRISAFGAFVRWILKEARSGLRQGYVFPDCRFVVRMADPLVAITNCCRQNFSSKAGGVWRRS